MSEGRKSVILQEQNIEFVDRRTGEKLRFVMPYDAFWAIYHTIKAVGVQRAGEVALFGALQVKPNLSPEDIEQLRNSIIYIHAYLLNGPDPVMTALELSYRLLHQVKISRKDARDLAAKIIGKPIPIDSWRKRVDAFAEDRGLPKVDLSPGRPKNKNAE